MQPMEMGTPVGTLGLLIPLSVIVIGTISLFLIRRYRMAARVQKIALAANLPRENLISSVARLWLAPTGVLAIFVALSSGHVRESQSKLEESVTIPIPHDIDHLGSHSLSDDLTSSSASDQLDNRPQWTHEEDRSSGDVRKVVLSSKLWSTEDEARHELTPRAAAIVLADFHERHNNLFERTNERFQSEQRLVDAAVKERYLERIAQDFGKFSSPMYRLWWQVEISPVVRTELYPSWRAAVLGNRTIALGSLLALMTLAANAAALFARLTSVSKHHSITAVSMVATPVVAWLACGLFVVKRLCQ